MKIPAPDLDRLVQNVLLYSDKKAIRLQEVFFVFGGETLSAYACDDYIAVGDSIPLEEYYQIPEMAFTVADTEKLGEWIKKDKKVVHKTDIEVKRKMTGFLFDADDDSIFINDIAPNFEAWDLVFDLLSEENRPMMILDYAVRPERLVKLARLKSDKEAPLHFRGVDINGHLIVQFKKGATCVGAIMPVDKSYVKEEFLW